MTKFILNFIAIKLIRVYQLAVSPFFISSCKFYPSCSNYAINAIGKLGLYSGLLIAIKRILNCHPYNNKSGYDPVP